MEDLDAVAEELARMISHQRQKVFDLAARLLPGLTEDDLTQPHDYPELRDNWHWNYEDGVLAGLLAAELTIRRGRRKVAP
jgi:hypothetical protein